ncbi:hypothetical protein QTP88_012836 [Uroleucon formosanum]
MGSPTHDSYITAVMVMRDKSTINIVLYFETCELVLIFKMSPKKFRAKKRPVGKRKLLNNLKKKKS